MPLRAKSNSTRYELSTKILALVSLMSMKRVREVLGCPKILLRHVFCASHVEKRPRMNADEFLLLELGPQRSKFLSLLGSDVGMS